MSHHRKEPHVAPSARIPLLAGTAILAISLGGAATYALWGAAGEHPFAAITAGDLAIELVDEAVWRETSGDVAGTPREIDPRTFRARPGDSFEIRQEFITTVEGENMLARVTVSEASTGPTLPPGVRADYVVLDDDGEPVGDPVALGNELIVDRVEADDVRRTDTFTLVVGLELLDGEVAFGPNGAASVVDLGTIAIDLQQVREGTGFIS